MKTHRLGILARPLAGALLALGISPSLPAPAAGVVKVLEQEDFSLELGLRVQPRMELKPVSGSDGGTDWQRDFLVRRLRLKAYGRMITAKYGFEVKIDGTDQIGSNPTAQVENAWIQYHLVGALDVRAGLYDQPFSRERLTSDSRQLVVDRTEVSSVPEAAGLADNAVGFHFLGKGGGGHAEYAVGLFDNVKIPGTFQNFPMVVGRLDLNLGSTKSVFQDTHFENESWCSVGVNGSYQGSIEDTSGADDGLTATMGIDGMIDIPAGPGRLFLRAEANAVKTQRPGAEKIDTAVWMAGVGYLIAGRFQPAVVFDQVRLDDAVGGGVSNITYLGVNFYQKSHSLKVQGDVRLASGTGESVDGGRIQAQLDF